MKKGHKIRNFIFILIIFLMVILFALDKQYLPPKDTEFVKNEIEKISNGKELPPKEFYTDGCSLWPDYFLGYSWEQSCVKHDIQYWLGGTEEDRLKADKQLKDEINEIIPGMGDVVYIGVRAGGRNLIPLIPFPWGWGYGWNNKNN